MSVLTKELPQGRKYRVNALSATASASTARRSELRRCGRRSWPTPSASSFEECNPSSTHGQAVGYAAPGAKVGGLPGTAGRGARLGHGAFGATDLVTVLIGANDVLDLYRTSTSRSLPTRTSRQPDLQAVANELTARGARLGLAINALTDDKGPKVIVSTIPLMNLTPYALQQAVDRPDVNVPNVLRDFSNTFNTAVRVNIPNDGRAGAWWNWMRC